MAALGGWCERVCKTGWLPALQFIRHGSKAVTRRWKPMNLMRKKLMEVTKYIPPKPAIPEECKPRVKLVEEPNGYEKLLFREVKETFFTNKMIVVCQYNYLPGNDIIFMKHRLRKHNIHVKFFPNKIVRAFLSESRYKNLLPLFVGRNLLIVSQETKAREMLRVLKNIPQMTLLGAYVDNVILSKQGFTNYANLPSMVITQGEVVGALSLMTSQTSTLLRRGPVFLTSLLDQYVKQQSCEAVEATEVAETPDNSDGLC